MKKAALIVLAVLMCLSLVACASSIEVGELKGTWSGAWEYNGKNINMVIEFEDSGNYEKAAYLNGELDNIEEGTYEIDGSKVILHENGEQGSSVEYKYKGGKLTNNGHSLSKE